MTATEVQVFNIDAQIAAVVPTLPAVHRAASVFPSPTGLADRLRQRKDELVALLRADGTRVPASTEQERLRTAYHGLTAAERIRLEAEAAEADTLARRVLQDSEPLTPAKEAEAVSARRVQVRL